MSVQKLHPRDLAILRHVALYRVGLYATISKLFFDGKAAGHILKKLDEELGLIEVHRRAIGKLSYVTLRAKGAALLGCPKERGRVEASALDLALGLSLYCCMGSVRRYRLEHAELKSVFESGSKGHLALPPQNVAHVAVQEGAQPKVLRVYQSQTSVENSLVQLRTHLERAASSAALKPYVLSGDYGFLCLGTHPEKVGALKAAAADTRLESDGAFSFGLGPDQSTVNEALRSWREVL
jgi:hypothetical protein